MDDMDEETIRGLPREELRCSAAGNHDHNYFNPINDTKKTE